MSDSHKIIDSLEKYRTILLVILMMPVIGMVISIPLILWKKPESTMVAIPIIGLRMMSLSRCPA